MGESKAPLRGVGGYPSVYDMALGHKAIAELLLDPVVVTEKIDGSQISFGSLPSDDGWELRCRSKGATINIEAPESMFARAVEVIRGLSLTPGWIYRGEYLAKPAHGTLHYARVPRNNIILFDINDGVESYLDHEWIAAEAERLGLEAVPLLYEGVVESLGSLRAMLDTLSVLGGTLVEGIVVKNYSRFGPDKKVLMGKLVSEKFQEIHSQAWKDANPTQGDTLDRLIDRYRTEARWYKAVQHLRELGQLEDSPRDIGRLILEIRADLKRECEEEIKERLMAWAWPHIQRGSTRGMPEWYKGEVLTRRQFEAEEPRDGAEGPNHGTDGEPGVPPGRVPGEVDGHRPLDWPV